MHFHFSHQTGGQSYSYTYPLGTGGAWANPIVFTEVYASCPQGYYLTASAPTMGTSTPYYQLHTLINSPAPAGKNNKTVDNGALQAATATITPPLRYPTAWHRAYVNCNPTQDITIRFARRPFDPLFLFISWWRDSDWVAAPFIVLGFFGSLLLSVYVNLRKAWLRAGQPGTLWGHGRRLLLIVFLPALITAAIFGICQLLNNTDRIMPAGFESTIFILFVLISVLSFPVIAISIWVKLLSAADRELKRHHETCRLDEYPLVRPVITRLACTGILHGRRGAGVRHYAFSFFLNKSGPSGSIIENRA